MIIGTRSELTATHDATSCAPVARVSPLLGHVRASHGRTRGGAWVRVLAAIRARRAAGTSLARVSDGRQRDAQFDEVDDRWRRARVKMLNNEIVFDIPCVVPEYVPPRGGARADRNARCVRTHASTDSRSCDRSNDRAPWLAGLCKRGTDQ